MTTLRVVQSLLLALLLAWAAAQGAIPAEHALELAVADVNIGDRGYGVTAAAGNELQRFEVEVLGVQYEAGNGFPLVLVRTSGPLIEASGGVAAGMSGSPVYIDTEFGPALLGAVGYVFSHSDHTVALVTPIENMREAIGAATFTGVHVPGYGTAHPVVTPILLTGASARAASLLEPLFGGVEVRPFPVQSGAAPAALDEAYELRPGSAVGVSLIMGAINMAAVGTVTTVEGSSLGGSAVLAFGHPFLGLGGTDLPFVPAYITAILPSTEVPFKLANVGRRVLGSIDQDRPTALAGSTRVQPRTVRVSLSIAGVVGNPTHELEVVADERLYPILIATATLQLLDRALGATSAGYADLAWQIGLRNGSQVNVIEQVNHGSDVSMAAALLAGAPLAVLAQNQFRAADVTDVSISLNLNSRQQVASIEEAVLESRQVPPGDAAHIHLRLQPHREQATVRTVVVPIPADLTGTLTLLIRGGSVPRDTGETELDEKEIDPPRTFGELLEALRHRVQASELVVEAITEDGELLRLLRAPFPFVVEGHKTLTVELTDEAGAAAPEGSEEPGAAPDTEPDTEPDAGPDAEQDGTEGGE